MRPHDEALHATSRYDVHARVLVNEIDLSAFLPSDPFVSATFGADSDQAATQGQIVLHLEPVDALINAAFDQAPRGGLPFRLQTATVAKGTPPSGWKTVWDGRIDKHVYDQHGLTMTCQCRDRMAYLLQHVIEPLALGGFTVPSGALNVSAQYLLDFAFLGTDEVHTIAPFGNPAWTVVEFWQDALMNVAQAIQRMVDQRGWAFHYRYPDTGDDGVFGIYDPENAGGFPIAIESPGSPPVEIGLGEIIRMTPGLDTATIRNRFRLIWGEDRNVTLYSVGASSDLYQYQFMQFSEDKTGQIDTQDEANRMNVAAGDQLAFPLLDLDIERLYWWPVQLGDRIIVPKPTWLVGLDRQQGAGSTLELAVTGWNHTLNSRQMRTTVRGSLVGRSARRRWLQQPPRMVHTATIPPVGDSPEGALWGVTESIALP